MMARSAAATLDGPKALPNPPLPGAVPSTPKGERECHPAPPASTPVTLPPGSPTALPPVTDSALLDEVAALRKEVEMLRKEEATRKEMTKLLARAESSLQEVTKLTKAHLNQPDTAAGV